MMRLLAIALIATLCTGGRADAQPDPYGLFASAEAYWFTQQYPQYLSYDVAVQVIQGNQVRVERYDSGWDGTDGSIWADGVSDYEREHPVRPTGMNFCIIVTCLTKPLPPIDFIGVPVLTPTYTFGMAPFVPAQLPSGAEQARRLVAEIRREFHDPYPAGRERSQASQSSSTLPTIAHEVAVGGIYVITLAGIESVDGHDCYHLVLRPRSDPGRYRLRDLWIDTKDSATWRLNLALNFVDGPGTRVPWTVDFDNVAGVQYIAQERADGPMTYQGQSYSQVIVSFENVRSVAVPSAHPLYEAPEAVVREPL